MEKEYLTSFKLKMAKLSCENCKKKKDKIKSVKKIGQKCKNIKTNCYIQK